MFKLLPSILLFSCFVSLAWCQSNEPIETDRPDQSDGTYTLSKNTVQLETGFTYGKQENDYLVQDIMLRYGLSSKTELRLLVDYGRENAETGIMPAGLSIKRQIISQKGWIPDITAVGYLRFPFLATSNFRTDKIPATLQLAFQNALSDKFAIGYNVGSSTDGESTKLNWVVTTSLGFSPAARLSFFAEYFSQFARSASPNHNLDLGALWLLKNNIQLDIAIGSTLFNDRKNKFITTGISYRFSK